MIKFIVILALIGFVAVASNFQNVQSPQPELESVAKPDKKTDVEGKLAVSLDRANADLHKVLDQKCSRCHGGEKTKGSFDLVRLLDKGVMQEDSASWNDVYRVLQDGDMPPEDEEQLSDTELLSVISTLESKLKSSKDVSRLLTADEIINSVSDAFGIDTENDNQLENLYSYQDNEHFSTVDNNKIMSVFFMNDYSQILDGVIDEYVKYDEVVEPSKPKSKKNAKVAKKPNFEARELTINSVGFASKSHYWPGKDFIDLRGRYAPHANALKQVDSKNLNLPPGKYRLSFDAATFNRQGISEAIDKYSNRMRLKEEKAKINIYLMPVYNKSRPSSKGKEKLVESFFIDDESFKTYTVELDLKRSTPVGLSFENGPHSSGRLKNALPNYPKEGVPPEEHKFPYVRFKDMKITLLSMNESMLSFTKEPLTKVNVQKKVNGLIAKLGLDIKAADIVDLYDSQVASGVEKFSAYKKALKAVFLSPAFLYLGNTGSFKTKLRFASYSLLKSAPDASFKSAYTKLKSHDLSPEKFIDILVNHENFKRFSNRFTYEWLELHEMVSNQPDEELFKEFYMENYSYAFMEQTNLFVENLFKENLSLRDLVQSDYIFVNDNLQGFYGLGKASAVGFRKVMLADASKGGLITQGSFMAATSNGVEALPFRRAKWISENILNKQIPPPPDNISVQEFEEAKGSFADKMKVHSTNSQCASCHKLLDPIASKLRYYDSIGNIEHHFKASEVQSEIKSLKEKYKRSTYKTTLAFTKRLVSFTTGRKTDISDFQTVEKIADKCMETDYKTADVFVEVLREYFSN
ncbi:MAG: DUF1588 domain-containing protein [Lentisphaeraceae bacterium]|nr:DUF1588 domain-containing protein [Lentisphaeraceae bacterium]